MDSIVYTVMSTKESYDGAAEKVAIGDEEDVITVNVDENTVKDWTEVEERAVKRK